MASLVLIVGCGGREKIDQKSENDPAIIIRGQSGRDVVVHDVEVDGKTYRIFRWYNGYGSAMQVIPLEK